MRFPPSIPVVSLEPCFFAVADDTNNGVHYLQSQNGNIYRSAFDHSPGRERNGADTVEEAPELAVLQEHLEPEVEFMSKALGTAHIRILGAFSH